MGFEKLPFFHKKDKEETPKDILRLPSAERPAALQQFQEKVVAKKEWFADIQERMLEITGQKPDLKAKELYAMVLSDSEKRSVSLTKKELLIIKSVAEKYERKQ